MDSWKKNSLEHQITSFDKKDSSLKAVSRFRGTYIYETTNEREKPIPHTAKKTEVLRDFKLAFGIWLKIKIILLFSLILLLFMSLIALFDTIHKSYCTILTNFYFYL